MELAFEDNRLAMRLFGEFDQNLAMIEQRFNIRANPRGNHIILKGESAKIAQAQRVLASLYAQLEEGNDIASADIDAMIRMVEQTDSQLSLPNIAKKSHIKMSRISTRKAIIIARSPAQDAYMRALKQNDVIFGVGPAGTGKTYLAVACAISMLERDEVSRIILSRPAVEAGERLGFLPGDMKEKVDPYLRPLYDALFDMMQPEKVERYIESGIIEIAPLAFMRGRTLANSVIILDEAQNTTSVQMKMFLTRLGENSKIIIAGDPSQIDLMKGQKSGLIEAIDLLTGIKNISIKRFSAKDIVRHELVGKIVEAYQKNQKQD